MSFSPKAFIYSWCTFCITANDPISSSAGRDIALTQLVVADVSVAEGLAVEEHAS